MSDTSASVFLLPLPPGDDGRSLWMKADGKRRSRRAKRQCVCPEALWSSERLKVQLRRTPAAGNRAAPWVLMMFRPEPQKRGPKLSSSSEYDADADAKLTLRAPAGRKVHTKRPTILIIKCPQRHSGVCSLRFFLQKRLLHHNIKSLVFLCCQL